MADTSFPNELVSLFNPTFCENRQLADPELNLYYLLVQRREFWLDTEISWDNVGFFVKWLNWVNKYAKDKTTPITLHIFSPGGDVDACFALIDAMTNSVIPIHTINEGKADSAAAIIFLAGTKRTMQPHAEFVLHDGSTSGGGGTFKESREAMKAYERIVKLMHDFITSHSLITEDQLVEHFEKQSDWYIYAGTAKSLGIITE